jgi:RHS repeat-associated protein
MVDAASAWRGKWSDVTGLHWFGARYYDAVAGRFISYDPAWNLGDAGGYSAFAGNPHGYWDPDGRLAARANVTSLQNQPPPYELGIAPYMSQPRIETEYIFRNGTSSGFLGPGQSILDDPDSLAGNRYRVVTEPTGQYFSYVRDTRDGGPLSDPNYGRRTEVPITRYDVEQQQRLEFLKAAPMMLLYLDGAGALLEGTGARLLAADALAARTAPRAYSVAFQTQLTTEQFGLRQAQHFQIANQAL